MLLLTSEHCPHVSIHFDSSEPESDADEPNAESRQHGKTVVKTQSILITNYDLFSDRGFVIEFAINTKVHL